MVLACFNVLESVEFQASKEPILGQRQAQGHVKPGPHLRWLHHNLRYQSTHLKQLHYRFWHQDLERVDRGRSFGHSISLGLDTNSVVLETVPSSAQRPWKWICLLLSPDSTFGLPKVLYLRTRGYCAGPHCVPVPAVNDTRWLAPPVTLEYFSPAEREARNLQTSFSFLYLLGEEEKSCYQKRNPYQKTTWMAGSLSALKTASRELARKTGASWKAFATSFPWIQPFISPHRAASGFTILLLSVMHPVGTARLSRRGDHYRALWTTQSWCCLSLSPA